MKKKFLKIVALVIVLCLMFSIPVYAEGNSANIADEIESRLSATTQSVLTSMEEVAKAEAPAQEQYANLLSKIRDTTMRSADALSNANNITLGDYYGGAYLNNDKKLTICTTSEDPKIVAAFIEATGSSDVVIQKVSNTLEEINETASAFIELFTEYQNKDDLSDEESALIKDIVQSRSDITINKYIVGIYEINKEKEQLFWSLFKGLPADIIKLEQGYMSSQTVTIRPGGELYLSANASLSGDINDLNQSVGYRAYRVDDDGEAVYGFVGCGHGAAYALYQGGEKVGDLYASRFEKMYDVAFYDITPGTTLSNVVAYADSTGNTATLSPTSLWLDDDILVGTTVMKVGARTGYRDGQVISIDASYTINGVTYYNFICTTALNLDGDSGGAAYIYYGGEYRIIGTMSASKYWGPPYNQTNFMYSYVASYGHSCNALGFRFYHY